MQLIAEEREQEMSSDPAAETIFDRLRSKFAPAKEETPKDHLIHEISQLQRHQKITDSEYRMLRGILNFEQKSVREVMVARPDAFMVDMDDPFQANLDAILSQPYSRIPVYQHDKDRIVGVIHIRTVLRKARKLGFDVLDYGDVMTSPLFAPEKLELGELLMEMQRTKQQLAILLDEYGGVTGLATIEDLIEEIVGDIDDEVDPVEVLFNQLDAHHYVIYGKMPLDDFNEKFGTKLAMEDVDTIAGYMITKLGLIPAKNEKLSIDLPNGMKLTTRRMQGSRLSTLLLTLPKRQVEQKEDSETD